MLGDVLILVLVERPLHRFVHYRMLDVHEDEVLHIDGPGDIDHLRAGLDPERVEVSFDLMDRRLERWVSEEGFIGWCGTYTAGDLVGEEAVEFDDELSRYVSVLFACGTWGYVR